MGLFDFITGSKKAPKGVAKKSVADLRTALLALNREGAPWQVRDGAPEGVDLVAEWKIVDAAWYEIFAKAGVERVFKVLMKFDDKEGEVRSVDREYTVKWTFGVPEISLSAEAFRGQKAEMSFESVYAFKEEDLTYGKIYQYNFKTSEIKKPLQDAAQAAGWGWKGVAFSKL